VDFFIFKQIIDLINNKQHLNLEGPLRVRKKILALKGSLNLGLNEEIKKSFPNIKEIERSLISVSAGELDSETMDPN